MLVITQYSLLVGAFTWAVMDSGSINGHLKQLFLLKSGPLYTWATFSVVETFSCLASTVRKLKALSNTDWSIPVSSQISFSSKVKKQGVSIMNPFIALFLFPQMISFKIAQCFPKTGFPQLQCFPSTLPPPPPSTVSKKCTARGSGIQWVMSFESTFCLDISAKKLFCHLSQATLLDEELWNENSSTSKMYQLHKHDIRSPKEAIEETPYCKNKTEQNKKPLLQNNQALTEMQSATPHFRRNH